MLARSLTVIAILCVFAVLIGAGPASTTGLDPDRPSGVVVEILPYGDLADGLRLEEGASEGVYRVPIGHELLLTDVDASGSLLEVFRGVEGRRELVLSLVPVPQAFWMSRSFTTGIRFGPGEGVIVASPLSQVEWLAMRGHLRALP